MFTGPVAYGSGVAIPRNGPRPDGPAVPGSVTLGAEVHDERSQTVPGVWR
jgi:hypothetical protein